MPWRQWNGVLACRSHVVPSWQRHVVMPTWRHADILACQYGMVTIFQFDGTLRFCRVRRMTTAPSLFRWNSCPHGGAEGDGALPPPSSFGGNQVGEGARRGISPLWRPSRSRPPCFDLARARVHATDPSHTRSRPSSRYSSSTAPSCVWSWW